MTIRRGVSHERLGAAGVLAANDVLAAPEFRVADAGCAEVLAQMPCRGLLDGRGIAQRADRVVQPEKKRQPLLVRAQLGFRLAVLERRPDPIGDLLDQRNLVGRPHPRRAAVNAERADETAVLDQQRTGVGPDIRRLQRRALLCRVRPGRGVIDRERPAFQDVCRATADQIAPLNVADQRGHTIDVVVDDDAVVALNLAVDHAVDAEVRAEQAACLLENARGIGERPDGVVQAAQERLPGLAPAQRLFGAGPFADPPHPVGGDFNQRDLIARPGPRRGAVDGERPEPSAALDERRADERRRLGREQLLALRGRESRIRVDVVDGHRLAAAACVDDGAAHPGDRAPARKRGHAVGIGPGDDEFVAIDVREMNAVGVEVLPDQADGDVLDLGRVLDGAQLLVERDQELPLDRHAVGSILAAFAGLPGAPVRT